jgi:L-ascorbate metabolism protein UlaG (beta-lactamase superfamily)
MDSSKLYLKPNVLAEPLYNQWYAWSSLIYPATASLYITNSHLKIMQSFVAAPQIHVAASKNPALLGGPYINLPAGRVKDVKALFEQTVGEQAHMLKLAEAIRALDEMLLGEADGHSIEPFYARVPDPLKGYVELLYDLHNNPSFRFLDGLLYRSPFYNVSSQSFALSLVERDDRPFVISTPRLAGGDFVHLRRPFADEAVGELFKMREAPQTYGHIREALGLGPEDDELFSTFFTPEPPAPRPRYDGDGLRVRYFGHACVLLETRETTVLTDPLVGYAFPGATGRYTHADLPETIDYAVITHAHQDHCMFETLIPLRHRIKTIVVPKSNGGSLADPSLKLVLKQIGFDNVREIDELETVGIDGGSITGLPFLGEHADLSIRTKIAYLVELKGTTALFAADSNNIEPRLYDLLHGMTGDVDLVFIGMECDGAPLSWLYGSLFTKPLPRKVDQSRRLDGSNYEKAVGLIDSLNPRQVYIYAMGQEPWLTFLTTINYTDESRPILHSNRVVEECRRRGIVSERLFGRKELFFDPR